MLEIIINRKYAIASNQTNSANVDFAFGLSLLFKRYAKHPNVAIISRIYCQQL